MILSASLFENQHVLNWCWVLKQHWRLHMYVGQVFVCCDYSLSSNRSVQHEKRWETQAALCRSCEVNQSLTIQVGFLFPLPGCREMGTQRGIDFYWNDSNSLLICAARTVEASRELHINCGTDFARDSLDLIPGTYTGKKREEGILIQWSGWTERMIPASKACCSVQVTPLFHSGSRCLWLIVFSMCVCVCSGMTTRWAP